MRKANLWVLAGMSVMLAACGGGDDVAVQTEEMPMTEPAVPVTDPAMGGSMGAMATTVTMQPLRDSGVTGEATVTPQGAQTEVMVRLTGLQAGGEHPGHIHAGTCDNVGAMVAPLQPITAGDDGTGTMTATAEIDPNAAMDGNHVVQYHQAGGGPGIVCGPIMAHQM